MAPKGKKMRNAADIRMPWAIIMVGLTVTWLTTPLTPELLPSSPLSPLPSLLLAA
jgi:hypothetical protein